MNGNVPASPCSGDGSPNTVSSDERIPIAPATGPEPSSLVPASSSGNRPPDFWNPRLPPAARFPEPTPSTSGVGCAGVASGATFCRVLPTSASYLSMVYAFRLPLAVLGSGVRAPSAPPILKTHPCEAGDTPSGSPASRPFPPGFPGERLGPPPSAHRHSQTPAPDLRVSARRIGPVTVSSCVSRARFAARCRQPWTLPPPSRLAS